MIIFNTFIVAVSQNADGTLRVTLQTLDSSFSTQVTVPLVEASKTFIGRAVNVTISYV